QALPESRVDFLTREEDAPLPEALGLFGRVFRLGGGRNPWAQKLAVLLLWPRLRREGYQVVLDLQRNGISRWLRRQLTPSAWCAFDRFAPCWAGERYRQAIEATGVVQSLPWQPIGLPENLPLPDLPAMPEGTVPVVLNPAGYFPTRNWPLERYLELADLLQAYFGGRARFVFLGLERIKTKVSYLSRQLGDSAVDLVGRTSALEALAVVQRARLVVSEDSGLAHLAWAARRPLVLLLGSSRAEWSAPPGNWVRCLDSSDLPCGGCLQARCPYGDVHCLSRYSAGQVFAHCRRLLQQQERDEAVS
ncbi:MAG: glycosyltransferase family 9 protein, partial [Calditrichaeota bacterium]